VATFLKGTQSSNSDVTFLSHDATPDPSCAPTNWWSAAALGGLMTGGGGAPRRRS